MAITRPELSPGVILREKFLSDLRCQLVGRFDFAATGQDEDSARLIQDVGEVLATRMHGATGCGDVVPSSAHEQRTACESANGLEDFISFSGHAHDAFLSMSDFKISVKSLSVITT